MEYGPILQNGIFRGDHNHSELNACVGRNGNPDYHEYANGFSVAATVLLEKVISELNSQPLKFNLDELIYPIAFTMRHAVELRLKDAALKLKIISDLTGRKIDICKLNLQHDIANLFQYISSQSIRLDERFHTYIEKLNSYISDIAEVDPNGQTFRYPYDNTGENKHLEQVSIINILVLSTKFRELGEILEEFHQFTKDIIEEYSENSYTAKLSRLQLFLIAHRLPLRHLWANDSFDSIRNDLKALFGVSSNELSKAIKIIERHYEMAPLIGITLPLKAVTIKELELFFSLWKKLHPYRQISEPIINGSSVTYEELIEHNNISREVIDELQRKLSPAILADLQALFELARFPVYSEYYSRLYEDNYRYLTKLSKSDEFSLRKEIDDLISKTNALEYMVVSLYHLGKSDMAKHFEQKYSEYFPLDKMKQKKRGNNFRPPSTLGYQMLKEFVDKKG